MKLHRWILWLSLLLVLGAVGPRVRSQEVRLRATTYILAGGPYGGPIYVDDDLVVTVNGRVVFEDNNLNWDHLPPISFPARKGDRLRVQAVDSVGGAQAVGPLYLFCEEDEETLKRQTLDKVGRPSRPGSGPTDAPFYDKEFKIKFSGK